MTRQLSLAIFLLCLGMAIPATLRAEARIVSTDAVATQILFALGRDDDLVGVDVTSVLPPDYRDLPQLGYHRALSPEGLLALEPTLVVGSEHIGPPIVLATLAATGIPVVQLPAATTVAQLGDNIARIASATGAEEQARAVQQELETLAAQLRESPLTAQSAAFVLTIEAGKLRIAGAGTAGNAFIELLGAHNVADFDGYRTLSAEALLELAPAVLLVANHEGGSPDHLLELNPILRHGTAATSGHILAVEAANLVAGLSPAAVAAAAELAAGIAPGLATN